MDELTTLRLRGLRFIALFSAAWTAILLLAILAFPLRHEGSVALLSLLMSGLSGFIAQRARYDLPAAAGCAISAALQPALFIALLDGHPWQMEGHMYFFAGMAVLTLTCDWRPILVATALIAIHHLGLSHFASNLLFMGNHGHLDRVLIHAVAVLLTFGLLAKAMMTLHATFTGRALADTEREKAEALAAEQRRRAEEAEEEGERRRKEMLAQVADNLEGSILEIAASVSAAAVELEQSAENMTRFAEETGNKAATVAHSARETAEAVATLAEQVAEMSKAVEEAAATAEEQLRLSERAQKSSDEGSASMRALIERTSGINDLVGLIKKVSFQTDILALNATVEAGRAGEAGQGFAVVASEVKALSNTSRNATGEINQMIGAVGDGAADADKALSAAAATLAALAQSAGQVGETMRSQRGIAGTIERSASSSANEVRTMVGKFEKVAEGATSAVQLSHEIRQAAARLGDIAQNLESETRNRLDMLRAA